MDFSTPWPKIYIYIEGGIFYFIYMAVFLTGRWSKNPKIVIFELAKFLVIFFDGEHDRTIGKMIWGRIVT